MAKVKFTPLCFEDEKAVLMVGSCLLGGKNLKCTFSLFLLLPMLVLLWLLQHYFYKGCSSFLECFQPIKVHILKVMTLLRANSQFGARAMLPV